MYVSRGSTTAGGALVNVELPRLNLAAKKFGKGGIFFMKKIVNFYSLIKIYTLFFLNSLKICKISDVSFRIDPIQYIVV